MLESKSETAYFVLNELVKEISKIGINSKIQKLSGNTYIVKYSCNRGMNLAKWIYKDSELYLSRKFQQYKVAINAAGGGMS